MIGKENVTTKDCLLHYVEKIEPDGPGEIMLISYLSELLYNMTDEEFEEIIDRSEQ